VAKLRSVGTVGRKTGSGAPKKRTEIVANVAARMEQSPKKPLRRLDQEMDLSYATCHKILKHDLNLHPYKITVVQELLPRDFSALRFNILFRRIMIPPLWICKQTKYANSMNPHEFVQSPLHPQKIGVWLAVSRRRIFGPVLKERCIPRDIEIHNLLETFF
jgi:hypothetical protein